MHRLVMTLANQYRRHTGASLSQALTLAWAEVKANKNLDLVVFTKINGEIAKRAILRNWQDYYTPKGNTSRRLKPGQVLFVDAARVLAGKGNPVISTYTDRIVK